MRPLSPPELLLDEVEPPELPDEDELLLEDEEPELAGGAAETAEVPESPWTYPRPFTTCPCVAFAPLPPTRMMAGTPPAYQPLYPPNPDA